MKIQQEAVHADLGGHLSSLQKMASDAVLAYKSSYTTQRIIHSKRSMASLIHDHFVDEAARFAENREGVSLIELTNLYLLIFDNAYAIRFKKVDADKIPKGHKTGQLKKFRNQQEIDGIPKCVNLDLTYQLNSEGDVHAIYLICPSGDRSNMWVSELKSDEVKPIVVSLFSDSHIEQQGAKIKSKKVAREENESESGDGSSSA